MDTLKPSSRLITAIIAGGLAGAYAEIALWLRPATHSNLMGRRIRENA
jgi:hypothetical protein